MTVCLCGLALFVHPTNGVAARGASTLHAKDSVVASHQVVRSIHAVPRVSFSHIDAADVVVVQEHRHGPRGGHGQADCFCCFCDGGGSEVGLN